MDMKKFAASAGIAGVLGFGALGLGAGLAQADNDDPVPPPIPGPVWHGDRDDFRPAADFDNFRPPVDRDDFRVPVDFDDAVPTWAPPAPAAPDWAAGAPVVWNNNLATWGIWWLGQFIPLPG